MKAYGEVSNTTGGKEVGALQSVLKILESLFFSMPIPEEIVAKYNFLKETKYRAAGLDFSPITKAQVPMRTASSRESDKDAQLDKTISNLSVEIMQAWIKTMQQVREGKSFGKSQTSQKLKEMQRSSSIGKTRIEYAKTLEELNNTYMNEAKLLLEDKEVYYAELKKTIEIQKTEISTLEKIISTINGRLKSYYETSAKEKIASETLDDTLGCTEVVIEHMKKLENDNQWLVEKLAEFGKENEALKKTAVSPEVLKEISSAKNLIKTFQKSCNDLAKVTSSINSCHSSPCLSLIHICRCRRRG
eukprot:TRINITY_DN22447_c0_g1_i1.p1 TRINITY_DN22447_c0_g1~~TRINITY_DN22447_c0_g1_i1.p1  ORF type:complete len:303 (-),score=76.43 TRINITY_DN22447_c0_g1_i1:39-947(-)